MKTVQSVTQVIALNTVRRVFPNLHLITSHKKQMKRNAVKHQYYNKLMYITNKPVCLLKSQNKQEKD